jgi:hypothetical protein
MFPMKDICANYQCCGRYSLRIQVIHPGPLRLNVSSCENSTNICVSDSEPLCVTTGRHRLLGLVNLTESEQLEACKNESETHESTRITAHCPQNLLSSLLTNCLQYPLTMTAATHLSLPTVMLSYTMTRVVQLQNRRPVGACKDLRNTFRGPK